jgi:hypothetical protein
MTYRVVQWATGAMGKTSLRTIIDRPDLELAGLYVYSAKKDGVDAGRIARRADTGVVATRRIEDIEACDADVVVHMPQLQQPYEAHAGDLIRLLASGKNVITITAHHHPLIDSPTVAADLLAACRAGGSTLFGTGVNPGVIMERLALSATGMCLDVEHLGVREVFDASGVADHDYVFDVMGMGSQPGELDLVDGPLARLFRSQFVGTLRFVGDHLDLDFDSVESDNEVVLAPDDIECPAGLIPRGTVAATRWQLHGMVDGRRRVTLDVNWTVAPSMTGHDDDGHWRVTVTGKPGIAMTVDLIDPVEVDVRTKAAQYATVAAAILAIPDVVAAPPGFFQLPTVLPWRRRLAPTLAAPAATA